MKTKWQNFLSQEIAIEYKTATYCFVLYFFDICYQLWQGRSTVSILTLIEMVLVVYVVTQIQYWIFGNFDEADHLRGRRLLGLFVCPLLYGVAGSVFCWFDGNGLAQLALVVYVLLKDLSFFYFNRLKRRIDSKHLNQLLKDYKERGKE
ncbi:DUF3021 domain-containing protein [Streptococcus merionis]|uniref:DUF3021 domain-containing protein n=1 Tax=Streptococcus merionis TaxID=400065 RepID=UPI0026F0511D|nr:DUF3021 domain-containing protein [Streptococcus merionis]